ncbi:MAG: DUF2141 domain-containing protein [Betaproteobacteria bacterium]|nr:DUF2141 domain-containing protein [Betaproteobacteria bacterium]
MKRNALFLATVFASTLAAAQTHTVTIEVTGVAEAKGFVLVAAFDKADGWLRRPAHAARVEATVGTVSITVPGLPEGAYAFSIVHDVNANNKLDSNAVGIPIEPYGFTNDAAGTFGPPKFEDARVKVSKDANKFSVKLN